MSEHLPPGRSWPLRAAHLMEALDSAGLDPPNEINLFRPYRPDDPDTVLEIGWGPKAYPYFDHWDSGEEYLWISVHDVPTNERADAERELRRVGVPAVVEWVRFARSAPDGWRLLRHHRTWRWTGGQVVGGVDE